MYGQCRQQVSTKIDGEMFDDWQICRTRASGDDGFYQLSKTTFRPVIAFENLGGNNGLAYNLGRQFVHQYPDETQRAEKIFYFVRDRVQYTPDIDQFNQDEFAQNADELATAIDQNGVGYEDCEDSAILLAITYKGAGYRSAIAVAGVGGGISPQPFPFISVIGVYGFCPCFDEDVEPNRSMSSATWHNSIMNNFCRQHTVYL